MLLDLGGGGGWLGGRAWCIAPFAWDEVKGRPSADIDLYCCFPLPWGWPPLPESLEKIKGYRESPQPHLIALPWIACKYYVIFRPLSTENPKMSVILSWQFGHDTFRKQFFQMLTLSELKAIPCKSNIACSFILLNFIKLSLYFKKEINFPW